jgi:hypothetical protein
VYHRVSGLIKGLPSPQCAMGHETVCRQSMAQIKNAPLLFARSRTERRVGDERD